jgi:hypothetical protein
VDGSSSSVHGVVDADSVRLYVRWRSLGMLSDVENGQSDRLLLNMIEDGYGN